MRRQNVTPGSYVGIASRAMVQAPLYSARRVDAVPAPDAGVRARAGIALSIPNLITLGRILLVPIVVWAIASGEQYIWIAFVLFLAAGVSDAVDGYLAKRFQMTTELGAYLDPLADKALIVSIYLTLGIKDLIPGWLVILGRVARHHDRGRSHAVLAGRDTHQGQTVAGIQAKHGCADCIRLRCTWHGWFQLSVADTHLGAHGPCRHADIAVGCRVCGRMGAPHQFDGVKTLSPRAPSRSRRKSTLDVSVVERHFLFWLAVLVLVVLALWLLSEILLPFVAGLAIAYLLTPLTDRLERFGINRLAAALLIIAVVVLALVYLILLVAPIVGAQLSSFIDSVPGNVTRLQALLGDPSRPWLQKLLGAGFSADKSIGDLVTQGVGWLTTFFARCGPAAARLSLYSRLSS